MKAKTIDVTERIVTNDENLYLSIKNREDSSIIEELLQKRYGYKDVEGYIWAERGSGYGHYIIHYQIYNFPISEILVPNFDMSEFIEDLENGNYERYTDNTFDGTIEKIKINN